MGYLGGYWRRYRNRFLLAIFFLALEATADLLQPAMMSQIVDRGVARSDLPLIEKYGGLMLLITFAGACCACMRNILSGIVSQNFASDLRQDLYVKIQGLSMKNINRFGSATLITRLTNDVTRVQMFANGLMRIMMKAPLVGIGSLVMAFSLNPRLSLILVAAAPLIVLLIYLNMRISYPFFHHVQTALDEINQTLQDYLKGVRVIKIFNRGPFEEQRFDRRNRTLARYSAGAAKIGSFFGPLINLTVNGSIVAILWFGGLGVQHGSMQVGSIIALTNYMMQILFAIMMVNNALNMFVRARASAGRIGAVFHEQADITFPAASVSPPVLNAEPALAFRHVFFSYGDAAHPFLRNIDFSVRRGEVVGVTGPVASGKTTLIHLILRFYDPAQGTVVVAGQDVRTYPEEALRRRIAVVPQRPLLFSGTVEANIRWGNADADEKAVRRAAKIAEADAFIRRLPDGYHSPVGQGGVNFSGGQKQRLSIARALIREPELLILDDATSALDAQTEYRIRRNLQSAACGTTCMIVSQRIASIVGADRIIVLNNGRIEAIGSHPELMKRSPYYRKMYRAQIGEGAKTDE
ncbi:MAG: ABC transporter ATP-binding protein/permease [Sporolactobacillus sp.]|jgi:ATP-binding cassette subfamily B protein|nr:ABC transporter ATP-binding protein/permease [Sporolactobacillus sp.]